MTITRDRRGKKLERFGGVDIDRKIEQRKKQELLLHRFYENGGVQVFQPSQKALEQP